MDEAVLDRMDDSLLFPIPDKKSRAQLLVQVRYVRDVVTAPCTVGLADSSPPSNSVNVFR